MWQTISHFVMTWLDPIGVVIGLLVALPVIWTWWEVVFGEKRQRRRWFDEVRKKPGSRPAILIVDLLPGKDIVNSVERFRTSQPGLRNIPSCRIFEIRRNRSISPRDMVDLHQELRRVAGGILASGADRLHYFHAGPAVVAAIVGAELANGVQVFVYHHQDGIYRNLGPLHHRL